MITLEDLPLADLISYLESLPPNLPYKSLTGTPPAPPGAPVTSLPSSPSDKEQAILVDSKTAPTYAWLMQYSISASGWIFIGGTPAEAEVETGESTSSLAYVDLATPGPSLTVAHAGTYLLSFGARLVGNNAAASAGKSAWVSPKIGSASAADADAALVFLPTANTDNLNVSVARTIKKTLAASDTVKLQYRADSAQMAAYNRWLTVTPVVLT